MENTTKKLKSENTKFSFIFSKNDITNEIISAYLTLEYNHIICTDNYYQTINNLLQIKQKNLQENITSIHTENNNILTLISYDDLFLIKNNFQ